MKNFIIAFICSLLLIALVRAEEAQFPENGCVTATISAQGEWSTYYYLRPSAIRRHVVITAKHEAHENVDFDVYARFGAVPNKNEYDAADLTLANNVRIEFPLKDNMVGSNLYVGAFSFRGTGNIELCAHSYNCPNEDCGSRKAPSRGTCLDTGVCECNGGFTGSGCEDAVVNANFGQDISLSLGSYQTTILKFNSPKEVAHLSWHIIRNHPTGWVQARLQYGRPPSDNDFIEEIHIYSSQTDALFHLPARQYVPGDYYLAITMSSNISGTAHITVVGQIYLCPGNCSGHGTCNEATSTCACDKGWDARADCSYAAVPLAVNVHTDVSVPGGGHAEYHFTIPPAIHSYNIDLTLHYESSQNYKSHPAIYVNNDHRHHTTDATPYSHTHSSSLPIGSTQMIPVPDHDLHAGRWLVSVYNSHSETVTGKLHYTLHPHCPKNCSGHGTCTDHGWCVCEAGWFSTDCAMDADACRAKWPELTHGFAMLPTVLICLLFVLIGAGVAPFIYKFVVERAASRDNIAQSAAATGVSDSDNQYAQLN